MSNFQKKEPKQVYNDLGTFVSVAKIERAGKPYLNIEFTPSTGPMAGKVMTRGGFADSLKNSVETIKSLREGDDVTLNVTLNKVGDKTYRNLVGVEAGHVQQASSPKKSFPSKPRGTSENYGKTYKNDYNDRAAKGQALNLAMQVAIAEGRASDDNYILSLIPRMIKLGEAVQSGETSVTTDSSSSTKTIPTPEVTQQDTLQATTVDDLGIAADIFADLDL